MNENFIANANATIAALENQRNNALNECVRLAAALTIEQQKSAGLEKELTELKAQKDKKGGKGPKKPNQQENGDGGGNSVSEHKS